jgi:hypothetical protein
MSVQQGRPSRFWAVVVAVALLLLGIILVVVVLLSNHLRATEGRTIVQVIPAGTPPPAAALTRPAGLPAQSAAVTTHPRQPDPKPDRPHGEPLHTARPPVKVIEKQVKVVEKQVKVVERPVKVVRAPVKASSLPARAPARPAEPSERTAAARESIDRSPETGSFQETGLPNQLRYSGKRWNASEVVKDLSTDALASDDQPVDGRTIYHDQDAETPYPCVYVKVAGETDQYVRYVPTTS